MNPWAVFAVGGWFIATAAIVSDWEMRASIAYAGGMILGYGLARCGWPWWQELGK